jgi:hypothetical protein
VEEEEWKKRRGVEGEEKASGRRGVEGEEKGSGRREGDEKRRGGITRRGWPLYAIVTLGLGHYHKHHSCLREVWGSNYLILTVKKV